MSSSEEEHEGPQIPANPRSPSTDGPDELLRNRLIAWALFTVVIALLPLAIMWHERMTAARVEQPYDFYSLLSSGDVILVSAVLAGAAVGDMLLCLLPPSRASRAGFVLLNAFLALVVFGVGMYLFAKVASRGPFYQSHPAAAAIETGIVLLLAVVASGSSICLKTFEEAT